jgi:hypothetical protein
LQTLTEADGVYEIWSGGRDFRVRPEICGGAIQGCSGLETIFKGTKYDYLAQADRLSRRFATIPGDTTRPRSVLIAPNHPPVADGLMQETVYLHSGELETGNVDLDAGGRNGWNVVFDRTYHSRTMVAGFLGLGWSSSIFRSVRALWNRAAPGSRTPRRSVPQSISFAPPTDSRPSTPNAASRRSMRTAA